MPTVNRDAYRTHAAAAAEIFKAYGALRVVECWGDDVPDGKLTSFPMAVQRDADETVVFAWIGWPSRAVRNTAWAKVREDLYDGRRMIDGGFETIVDV